MEFRKSGRCFTFFPTKNLLKNGVGRVQIKTVEKFKVYMHAPDHLMTSRQKISFEVPAGMYIRYSVEYEVLKMLTFGKASGPYPVSTAPNCKQTAVTFPKNY